MYFLTNLCRLCLSYNDEVIDMCNDNIIEKLISLISDLGIEEHVPSMICTKCLEQLDLWFEFRNKCLRSEFMLNKYIAELSQQNNFDKNLNMKLEVKLFKDCAVSANVVKSIRVKASCKNKNVNRDPVNRSNLVSNIYTDITDRVKLRKRKRKFKKTENKIQNYNKIIKDCRVLLEKIEMPIQQLTPRNFKEYESNSGSTCFPLLDFVNFEKTQSHILLGNLSEPEASELRNAENPSIKIEFTSLGTLRCKEELVLPNDTKSNQIRTPSPTETESPSNKIEFISLRELCEDELILPDHTESRQIRIQSQPEIDNLGNESDSNEFQSVNAESPSNNIEFISLRELFEDELILPDHNESEQICIQSQPEIGNLGNEFESNELQSAIAKTPFNEIEFISLGTLRCEDELILPNHTESIQIRTQSPTETSDLKNAAESSELLFVNDENLSNRSAFNYLASLCEDE